MFITHDNVKLTNRGRFEYNFNPTTTPSQSSTLVILYYPGIPEVEVTTLIPVIFPTQTGGKYRTEKTGHS